MFLLVPLIGLFLPIAHAADVTLAKVSSDEVIAHAAEIYLGRLDGHSSDPDAGPVNPGSISSGCDSALATAQKLGFADYNALCAHPMSFVRANYWLRTAAFTELGFSMTGATYFDDTDKAMEELRATLRNPAKTRETYAKLKPRALVLVKASGNRVAIQAYLREVVVPDFQRPASKKLRAAHATASAEYAKSHAWWRANLDTKSVNPFMRTAQAAQNVFVYTALDEGFVDPLILQWRLRREAEGGQALVDTWAGIVSDFASSM